MGAVATSVGDIFSGASSQASYNAQKNIARENARVAERNADWTMAAGENAVGQQGLKNRQISGAIKARQAAGGVDVNTGSNAQVQQSQRELGQLDAMTIQSNAARAAYGYKQQAVQFRNQAALAKAAANQAPWAAGVNALSDLVGGASKAATQYQQWQQATGDTEAAGAAEEGAVGSGSADAMAAALAF